MAGRVPTLAGASCALLTALTACVSVEEKQAAIAQVNAAFKQCYERTIRAHGSHHVNLPRAQAMARVAVALQSLGMTLVGSDLVTSAYLRVQAPAPAPLDNEEWRRAVQKDLPEFRRIVADEVGLLGWFVNFEPQGLDIAIRVTGVTAGEGTDLFATMRMVERTPPPSGWPRREYPPCTALEVGIDKLWRSVDRHL